MKKLLIIPAVITMAFVADAAKADIQEVIEEAKRIIEVETEVEYVDNEYGKGAGMNVTTTIKRTGELDLEKYKEYIEEKDDDKCKLTPEYKEHMGMRHENSNDTRDKVVAVLQLGVTAACCGVGNGGQTIMLETIYCR
ncbi:MAG: hypothetical protein LBG89_02995 [Rickettsiales bacterium]|jgi:hypothetical protein|nr:hypothetical protein [Rickettsiales bacterium]